MKTTTDLTKDTFVNTILKHSPEELEHRCKRLRNVLEENDLSSTVGVNHKGTDPLPLIIKPEEWLFIEKGINQRARLFNALAKDIYGEQRLWKEGKLPSALLFANPDFLQVAWKVKPISDIYVHLAASDVVRLEDGSYRIVADHLQVPEGLGRALENRIGVSRAFPELFRSMHTERLAGFFKKMLDGLYYLQGEVNKKARESKLSNDESEFNNDGKIVMLASGPDDPHRAEDAIIARYLGIPLVENDDLAVRNLHVYMKTLMGLKKISAIFRRVKDRMCDPLELSIDSGEGAVGLISTVRAGNVAISNFMGTGVLESALFKPYLPEICKELLNEDLLIPDVETVWLGEKGRAREILNEPEKWIFRKAIFGNNVVANNEPPKKYASMTTTAQLALIQSIEENPEAWEAERDLETTIIPAYKDGKFVPAKASMRFFAVNTTEGTCVMPGGLGMIQIENENVKANTAEAFDKEIGEKDIWVLSEKNVPNFSLLAPADQPVRPSRAGGDLPSRAAENLFRLGRNLSASNMMARIARGIAVRLSDESWMEMPELQMLLKAGIASESLASLSQDPELALRRFILRKDDNMQCTLTGIRELAVQVRDRISEDLWLALNSFGVTELPAGTGAAALLPYLKSILADSTAVAGLAADSMTRGHEWRFLEMGRQIESAIRTLQLIKNLLTIFPNDETAELRLLQSALEIGDGLMTYHRRYGGRLQFIPVLDLLLSDESNPRSVAYQIAHLREETSHLPGNGRSEAMFSPLDKELLHLLTDLRLANIEALAEVQNGKRKILIDLVNEQTSAVEHVAEIINKLYLNHAPKTGIVHALATEV